MVRKLRLAMAQINTTVGDLEGNTSRILEYVERARAQQADLVVFPEMAIPGYPPEDLLFKPSFIRANIDAMQRVVAASSGITVVVGFVDLQGDIYNAAAVAHDGRLLGVYHKMYLPNYGVFDEERYFKAGRVCPVYVVNGTPVGVNVCEDIWYAVGPSVVQRRAGAEDHRQYQRLSPYYAEKRGLPREDARHPRFRQRAVYVAYLNMVGGQDELVFDGGSMVYWTQAGEIVARGSQFQEELIAHRPGRRGRASATPAARLQAAQGADRPTLTSIGAAQRWSDISKFSRPTPDRPITRKLSLRAAYDAVWRRSTQALVTLALGDYVTKVRVRQGVRRRCPAASTPAWYVGDCGGRPGPRQRHLPFRCRHGTRQRAVSSTRERSWRKTWASS